MHRLPGGFELAGNLAHPTTIRSHRKRGLNTLFQITYLFHHGETVNHHPTKLRYGGGV